MNADIIADYLESKGYAAYPREYDSSPCVEVKVDASGIGFRLLHYPQSEYSELPRFYLKNADRLPQLAHVDLFPGSSLGMVCVGDQESVSVNYERPELAIEYSLGRHIELIEKALHDSDWNKYELLREFYSHWSNLCGSESINFICAAIADRFDEMDVVRPPSGSKPGFKEPYIGVAKGVTGLAEYSYIARGKENRKRSLAGPGIVVPIDNLSPPPSSIENLKEWYLNTINSLRAEVKEQLKNKIAPKKAKEFWIIFNGNTPSGRTWFGLQIKLKKKSAFPLKPFALDQCKLTPVKVDSFNKERLMPRSGADPSLSQKSVLLIGCGSVGGEIAHKLGGAGVGRLLLSDPDTYSIDNIYRHVLTENVIGWPKAEALGFQLQFKFPWIQADSSKEKLLELRDQKLLERQDLIIIAIGSPTHERIFHDYLETKKVNVAVINTWVEGYGLGGHATLDIPSAKGCLRCAYFDQDSLGSGLASNLNFFETNQNLTTSHAGCGDLYLPYSNISSTQTAVIAADLAIKFLNGRLTESSKISWKGDSHDALANGFKLTHRYENFDKAMEVLPLYDENCDRCNE